MGVEVAASHPLGAQSFALVTASPSPQGGPGPTLRSSGALAPGRQAPPQSGHQKQRGVLGVSPALWDPPAKSLWPVATRPAAHSWVNGLGPV